MSNVTQIQTIDFVCFVGDLFRNDKPQNFSQVHETVMRIAVEYRLGPGDKLHFYYYLSKDLFGRGISDRGDRLLR